MKYFYFFNLICEGLSPLNVNISSIIVDNYYCCCYCSFAINCRWKRYASVECFMFIEYTNVTVTISWLPPPPHHYNPIIAMLPPTLPHHYNPIIVTPAPPSSICYPRPPSLQPYHRYPRPPSLQPYHRYVTPAPPITTRKHRNQPKALVDFYFNLPRSASFLMFNLHKLRNIPLSIFSKVSPPPPPLWYYRLYNGLIVVLKCLF